MNIKLNKMQEIAIKDKALRKSLALLDQLDGLDITATRNKLLEAYTNLILEYEYLLTVRKRRKDMKATITMMLAMHLNYGIKIEAYPFIELDRATTYYCEDSQCDSDPSHNG
jgi:hypothetical protein